MKNKPQSESRFKKGDLVRWKQGVLIQRSMSASVWLVVKARSKTTWRTTYWQYDCEAVIDGQYVKATILEGFLDLDFLATIQKFCHD